MTRRSTDKLGNKYASKSICVNPTFYRGLLCFLASVTKSIRSYARLYSAY